MEWKNTSSGNEERVVQLIILEVGRGNNAAMMYGSGRSAYDRVL